MVNALFVADKLLQRLAPLDLDSVSHHVLPDALSALSQLATAQAAYRQAAAAERQADALERIAKALCMDNDLTVIDALYALAEAVGNRS